VEAFDTCRHKASLLNRPKWDRRLHVELHAEIHPVSRFRAGA